MENGQVETVFGVDLNRTTPTTLALKELHDWVIWQFPRRKAKSHFAAVKPSIEGHGWFPAMLDPSRKQVTVYANIPAPLDSPEAASRQLEKLLVE